MCKSCLEMIRKRDEDYRMKNKQKTKEYRHRFYLKQKEKGEYPTMYKDKLKVIKENVKNLPDFWKMKIESRIKIESMFALVLASSFSGFAVYYAIISIF